MIRADIPLDQIHMRADARPLNQEAIDAIATSLAEVGLITPIRVRKNDAGWELIAGAHRVAASRQLGLVDIAAIIATDDDLHAELAMIDENLCRSELSPADRAKQTARRKAIYLELHPETAQGAVGRGGYEEKGGQVVHSFAEATAVVTGADARTVRRDAERGEKVIDEVIDLIRGTKLDTGTYLDKLKKLPPNDQVIAAKRDLAFMREQERQRANGGIARRVVKVADQPLSDEEAAENQYAALVAAWNKAGEAARQRFRELIDTPVFDRSAA